MNLSYIIEETLLMAGFTFIVGIAFAYALKLTTFFFSRLNGHDLPVLLRKSRIWERAYRMNVPHLPIHPLDRPQRRPSETACGDGRLHDPHHAGTGRIPFR